MAADDLLDFTCGQKCYPYNKKNKPFAFYPEANYLIIKFPNSGIFWKIFYRLLLLALLVASLFPLITSLIPLLVSTTNSPDSITSVLRDQQQQQQQQGSNIYNMDQLLTLLFNDLTNEGLMKKTQQHYKAVFIGEQQPQGSHVFNMDHMVLNDMEKQNTIVDDTVDFIFTHDFPASSQFIERTLKEGGVVTVLLNDNPSALFYKPLNFKFAYMRQFEKIAIMAMRKTGPAPPVITKPVIGGQRKLCGYAPEAKKAALERLEDVLLEPPRAASGKSRVYLKRTRYFQDLMRFFIWLYYVSGGFELMTSFFVDRYLPDLMGDTLESYSRRVFIDVGLPEKDGTDWFRKNYPTRNKNFDMYKVETVAEGSTASHVEMSDWLRKNVREEEYVVMKAEAEVVEETMRSKAILLVDELFLECKPRGNRSRRAYWECLALYGKLRDQGVAVHQWWG